MNQQKVIERLIYEQALLHNRFQGRKWPIDLHSLIAAGKEEPRIYEVLPAIIKIKPGMIRNLKRDLQEYPKLKNLVEELDRPNKTKQWKKIPVATFRKQYERLNQIWTYRKSKTKWRNLNLRVSEENLRQLEQLCKKWGQGNKSEVIRKLIKQALD